MKVKLEWVSMYSTFEKARDLAYDFVEDWNNGVYNYDYDWEEILPSEIDNSLMYYSDQWEILENYCSPTDANWEYALERYIDDVFTCIIAVED